ncbi:MAG: CapA family protein [Chloroflexota bacterium]|nr:CapA family protein [Chloroflexota bacterium]
MAEQHTNSQATARRGRTRRLALLAILVLIGATLLTAVLTRAHVPTPHSRAPLPITGRVIDLDGKPLAGAQVSSVIGQTVAGPDGTFTLTSQRYAPWITAKHQGYLTRTRAAAPGTPVIIRLTPDDGKTVVLHFAGDTMAGRRFYDPNEDGDTSDGQLRPGASAKQHQALLQHVQPLLEAADLTIVNLETPVVANPYFDPTRPRPTKFHPTKDYAFATAPAIAPALREAGVDIVGLGNNHLFDVLDQGVRDTLSNLQAAGFQTGIGYTGAGMSEQEAWTPAVKNVRDQRIAFLACTVITGIEHPIDYVASDDTGKGGAAKCDSERIRASITDAKAHNNVVVFMIHGGQEYVRAPTEITLPLTRVAREAGATLVINHHPHVVGGFDWDGSSFVAWTLGNFLFDQTVWPTFESYLLGVQLGDGQVIGAHAEPLMIEEFVPKGVTGELADFVARGAAGRSAGPFVVENGAMYFDAGGSATAHSLQVPLQGDAQQPAISRLREGWRLSDFQGSGEIRLGRDLLWVGSFEDEDTDNENEDSTLWDFRIPGRRIGPAYAFEGQAGVRLERRAGSRSEAMLTPLHRILVQPGAELSVTGMVRATTGATPDIRLGWYPDTTGPSAAETIEPITIKAGNTWQPFRLDVKVPPDAVAVGLFLRLSPPTQGMVTADFDNIRLIEWAPVGTPTSQLYDFVSITGSGEALISKELLPGAEQWSELQNPMVAIPAQ